MPDILRCDLLDLNKRENIIKLKNVLDEIVSDSKNYFELFVSKKYYFKLNRKITTNPGWYIILDKNKIPLYVGKSTDLNHRLNSENGSRDQFANPLRKFDSVRNFIKKFSDLEIFKALSVCVIDERHLCEKIGLEFPLKKLDRDNIEKFIDIFRTSFTYK